MKKFLFVATLALSALAAGAQENYAAWSGHRNVFLNTTLSGASTGATVTNFPVLVRLGAADAAIFAAARAKGIDVRFTKANDATRLPHQIDLWDSAGKSAAIWVRVDTVLSNNLTQRIRMHWGKADAADSSNGTAVFSNGFTDVWHLGNADSTAARPNAVSGRNPATPVNFSPGYIPTTGMVGKADSLRGGYGGTGPNGSNIVNNPRIDLGANTNDYAGGITFSAWVYPTKQGVNVNYYVASSDAFAVNPNVTGLIILGTSTSRGAKFRQRNSGNANVGIQNTTSGELDGLDSWRHMVYTKDAADGAMYVYLNGQLVASNAAGAVQAYTTELRTQNWLGASHPGLQYSDSGFAGLMDEVRLANVPRSEAWAKLEYENQQTAQTLVVFDSVPVSLASASRQLRAADLTTEFSGNQARFTLAAANAGGARLLVTDLRGRAVWSGTFAPGVNSIVWNGQDRDGSAILPGVYAVRVSLRGVDGGISGTLYGKLPVTR